MAIREEDAIILNITTVCIIQFDTLTVLFYCVSYFKANVKGSECKMNVAVLLSKPG